MSTMLSRILRFGRQSEGVVAVEMAIVLPLFLLLTCGIIDFGNLFFQQHNVSETARAMARAVSVLPSSQNPLQDVQNYIRNNYAGYDLDGNPDVNNPGVNVKIENNNLSVTVTKSVSIMTPIISAFFPSNPFPVSSTCVMRMEN